jgi:hypothetical protein
MVQWEFFDAHHTKFPNNLDLLGREKANSSVRPGDVSDGKRTLSNKVTVDSRTVTERHAKK